MEFQCIVVVNNSSVIRAGLDAIVSVCQQNGIHNNNTDMIERKESDLSL